MAKRTKLSPKLPREVILKIAQFLPNEATYFAYIIAVKGTSSDQGSMEALWNLGQTTPQWDLWPNLELRPMGADAWELAIQAIPLYETVNMHAPDDLHRMVDHVTSSTNLVVVHDKPDPKRMSTRFDQLAKLPVRGLHLNPYGFADHMPMVVPYLLNVWPSMTHLRSLELPVSDQASLGSICKYLATSRITELRLEGPTSIDEIAPHTKMEGKVWADLVAWMHSTKVRRFDLHTLRLNCDDDVSMQALNGALAASDAMQCMTWTQCAIRNSAPLVLPPRLRKLCLPRCSFELVGIECILKLLPSVRSLTHVRFDGIPLSPSAVDTLASVLAHTNVSYLNLDECSVGDGGHFDESIQRLADAFVASKSLRTLHLMNNALGFNGVKAILAAVERRPHVTEIVVLLWNGCEENRRDELQNFVDTRLSRNDMIYV